MRERYHPWVGTDAAGLEYDNCNQYSMTNVRKPVLLTPNSLPECQIPLLTSYDLSS